MDCLLMDEFELKIVQFCKVLRYVFVGDGVVLQVAIQVLLVAWHVDESVTGETEEDDFLFARLFASVCFANGGSYGMAAFGCRHDAFGACEEHSGIEGLKLWNVHASHHAVLQELRNDDACAVIAETACVDVAWFEVVS